MDRYQYEPLPPLLPYGQTPPYTRLVRILPGCGDGPVNCSLFTVNVENSPPYESLSYVWGSPSSTKEPFVLCNGCPVTITPNLDRALRWLRYPHHERLFWIDAICIDQENVDERSRQVGYMRLVYKFATRAIVWLGPKQTGMDQAFDAARRLQILKDMPADVVKADLPDLYSMVGMTEEEFQIGIIYLSELLDAEYFCRIWCVQEVVTSKQCIAKCEDQELDFLDLLQLVPFILECRGKILPDKPLTFWTGIPVMQKLCVQEGIEGSAGPLLNMLAGTKDFKASDPRDKVFALLGISNEGISPDLALTKIMGDNNSWKLQLVRKAARGLSEFINNIAPAGSAEFGRPLALTTNYKKPVKEVYRDLTRFLLRASPRVLDVLSHVQHTSYPGQGEFPSWVPKWHEPRQVSILSVGMFLAGFCDGHFRYFANIDDNPMRGSPKEPDKLHIEGFKVDQIVKVTQVMSFGLHEEWPGASIWRQLFDFPLYPSSKTERMPLYRNGERLDIAFLLAATAFPLGTVVFRMDLRDLENNPKRGDSALPFIAESRATAAAYILANTPLDTTSLPHYASINSEAANGDSTSFHRVAKIFSHNRRFYLTKSGYLGIGPAVMQAGDEICVLFGGRMPFILRPMADHHLFIGDSYVLDDHIMWGKATEQVKRGQSPGSPVVSFELR